MGNAIIIFLVIAVISAIIGGITQLLKRAQQAEQERLAERRATGRNKGSDRQPSNDIDRFLEEIDKLRRKGGVEPPVARPTAAPIPTVAPSVAPRHLQPDQGFAATPPPPVARVLPRLEDLPVAPPVVTAPKAPAVARRATPGQKRTQPKTDFSREFVRLMSSKQSVTLAVVMQEVLGPPRCKKA